MLTKSEMQPLGSVAPDFTLPNTVDGTDLSLEDTKGEVATVIMFICNHCPYVQHVNSQIVAVANDYQEKGISFVGISANDVEEYPQDGPEEMKKQAEEVGYTFPYLYDKSQDVARAYGAVCTPDFFVYDNELKLAYRGRLDAASPGNNEPNDGKDLRSALDSILAGEPISDEQAPSMGCNIKWKN